MFKFFKNLFFGKSLTDSLHETKTVRVCGIKFVIRRIDITNHLEGLKVLLKSYAVYEDKKAIEKGPSIDDSAKIKEIYKDIFLAGVVHPKLLRNKGEGGQDVNELFFNWEMCHRLYSSIMDFTGKKKVSFI